MSCPLCSESVVITVSNFNFADLNIEPIDFTLNEPRWRGK